MKTRILAEKLFSSIIVPILMCMALGVILIGRSPVALAMAPGTITTVAGNGTAGYSGDGGPATEAEMFFPTYVVVDASGNLYISDDGNDRIRKVTALMPATPSPGEQKSISFTIGQNSYTTGGQSFTMDASPFISNERALVPERYLADALGAQTTWDAATQTITIIKGGTTIELTIGSTSITTNGKASQMDAAPCIENGRVYLPARYVAEAFGYAVSWDASSQTVTVSQGN
jgi:hypothetical protein